jgi:predicted enzyme related to lactoylglutathione lyase
VTAGASVLADHRKADGTGWVTLADPEGNEFCVERGAAERGPARPATFRIG